MRVRTLIILLAVTAAAPAAQDAVNLARLNQIQPVVEDAIRDRKLPGAVVLIGRGDTVVYQRAIGNRALEPSIEAMTTEWALERCGWTPEGRS